MFIRLICKVFLEQFDHLAKYKHIDPCQFDKLQLNTISDTLLNDIVRRVLEEFQNTALNDSAHF